MKKQLFSVCYYKLFLICSFFLLSIGTVKAKSNLESNISMGSTQERKTIYGKKKRVTRASITFAPFGLPK
jgi:hypothetical protein